MSNIKKVTHKWFVHIERINEERIEKRIYEASVNGKISQGYPKTTQLDQILELALPRVRITEGMYDTMYGCE